MRLKICDSHLTCKVANKCLNVREGVEVVEWNKMVPSLPLLSCELSVSLKENPDRKKKDAKKRLNTLNIIKNSEVKHKRLIPGQKELLNLFNDLSDIILADKTLMSSKDED